MTDEGKPRIFLCHAKEDKARVKERSAAPCLAISEAIDRVV